MMLRTNEPLTSLDLGGILSTQESDSHHGADVSLSSEFVMLNLISVYLKAANFSL